MPLLLLSSSTSSLASCLLANLATFVLDYAARQKVGGTHLTYNYFDQLPILSPSAYAGPVPWKRESILLNWVRGRVLELVFTARDLRAFARECGYEGRPVAWDEQRRFLIRCELDAAFFHLYGIAEDEVNFIMDTFPIVRAGEEQLYGSYRTKEAVLEMYRAMRKACGTGDYKTTLDPPPADL
jgi:hypothetical protein